MQAAIKVNETDSVQVIFAQEHSVRLTQNGFEPIDTTVCTIVDASDVNQIIGQGLAFRAPEDAPDDLAGAKLSFERAVKQAFRYDREARTKLHEVFRNGVQLNEAASSLEDSFQGYLKEILAADKMSYDIETPTPQELPESIRQLLGE